MKIDVNNDENMMTLLGRQFWVCAVYPGSGFRMSRHVKPTQGTLIALPKVWWWQNYGIQIKNKMIPVFHVSKYKFEMLSVFENELDCNFEYNIQLNNAIVELNSRRDNYIKCYDATIALLSKSKLKVK